MSKNDTEIEEKKSPSLRRKIANAFIKKRDKKSRPKGKKTYFESGVSNHYLDSFEEDSESSTNQLLELVMKVKGGEQEATASVISEIQKWIRDGVDLSNIDFSTLQNMDLGELPASVLQALIEFLLKHHPELVNLNLIDLKKVDLRRINFKKLNLKGVNLLGVNLDGIDLSGVDLTGAIVDPKYIFKGQDLYKGSAKIEEKKKANYNAFGVDLSQEFDEEKDKDDVEYDPSHFSEEFKEKFELKHSKKVVRRVKSRPSVKLHESEFKTSEHDFPDLFKAERGELQDQDNVKNKKEAHKAVLNAKKEKQRAAGVKEKEKKVKRKAAKIKIGKVSRGR